MIAVQQTRLPPIQVPPLRVLMVEDNPGDALLVRLALDGTRAGVRLLVCESLGQAAEVLRRETFDVALLDLSLPDSFGLATVHRLQALAPMLPIVVMTGLDDPEMADRALESGAQDFLVKGDFPSHLVERAIRHAIGRMNAEQERRALLVKLAAEKAEMAREMERARATQSALLPSPQRLGRIRERLGLALESHFEPSLAIGGDLWGCAELPDGKLALYAFDFSGHGISAALNVFRLHTLIAEHPELAGHPDSLLAHLNDALVGLLAHGHYATMFYAVCDTKAETLSWAAAGSPRPVLVKGVSVVTLDTAGLPLGLRGGTSYPLKTCPFPKMASLLVYSDALTDACDADDTFIGEDGLIDLLAQGLPDESAGRLDRLLDRFFARAGRQQADDMTALWMWRA